MITRFRSTTLDYSSVRALEGQHVLLPHSTGSSERWMVCSTHRPRLRELRRGASFLADAPALHSLRRVVWLSWEAPSGALG